MVARNENKPNFLGADESKDLANNRSQFIQFYHIPSGRTVSFKAFLTVFSDQYSSNWNDEEVFGRMDPITTFKGTRRIVSLGWDVVAGDLTEAVDNLDKCSLLFSMLYPSYEKGTDGNNASVISTSPLFRLKFMNLIQNAAIGDGADAKTSGLLGRVSGFVYEPDLESGFFDPRELQVEKNVDRGGGKVENINETLKHHLFPQTINLQCEFTVLHEHELGWKSERSSRNDPPDAPRDGFDKFPYSNSKSGNAAGTPSNVGESTTAEDTTRVGVIRTTILKSQTNGE